MKKLFLITALIASSSGIRAQSLSGIVTDSVTHQTLPGVIVSIPQLKLGATTELNGTYKISNLPKGTYEVEVEFLGYATLTRQITIKKDVTLNFALAVSAYSEKEVVVTALGNITNQQRSPVPVTMVPHAALLQESSTNAVDAIATQPGVTAITTGPGVSKPEINGLGYNRVLTLMDGVRQEDMQWGDEHGILIDPYAVYDAEIIRGPASLQYGANAVAGVVSFKTEPYPESGTIRGSVLSEYQTNNGLIGNSFDLGGNHNGFIWDFRASESAAHCYSDPHDGYVWGTAYDQYAGRLVLGLNKQWGYSRLTVSDLHRQIEIPDGNRDSTSGAFEFDVPRAINGLNPQYDANGILVPGTGQVYPTRSNFLSYNPDISGYQILDHQVVCWQNSISTGMGRIEADVDYTQSHRQEIDSGVVAAENLTVHDLPYSFKYQVAGVNSGLKLTTGVNGMYEWGTDAPEPPAPYVGDFELPDYTDFDIGGYAILNKDFKNLSLSGGLRYDYRNMVGQSMYLANDGTSAQEQVPAGTPGAYQQFPVFDRSFTGLSGSLGASYQLPENNYVKINMARSYRAPSILELTSNEADPANIYKQGDPNLNGEVGYETDIAYGNNGKDFNFEVDGFYNRIDNFIFADRIGSVLGGDSLHNGVPVYKFGSSNTAIIAGITAYFNVHPTHLKWFELDNGFTYIYSLLANQTDSTDHVPFTPAPRLTSTVKLKLTDKHNSVLKGTYIAIGVAYYWAQNDIYSALWNELPSSPYGLFNAGVGTSFINPKTKRVVCSLYINCTNLMNIAYIDHTSREQYFWAYNGTYAGPANYGVTSAVVTKPSEGIYNMGRNIGFKLIFPIGGHKTSDVESQGIGG